MLTRIITVLIALPLVVLPIYFGGVWCALLVMVGVLIAGYEFFRMMDIGGYYPLRWVGLAWIALFVISGWQPDYVPFMAVLVAGLLISMTATLPQTNNPSGTWMSTSMVAIYIGVPAALILLLRAAPMGLMWVTFALIITWANDIFAYFTGVFFGKHRPWPRLSPKKTWEGTIGGWVASTITAVVFVWLSPLDDHLLIAALIGLGGGVLGLLGDLSISMLKRQAGIKDSGTILPGHGGLLDRLDSLLFVIPFVSVVVLQVLK